MANELLTGLLGQPKGPAAPGSTQNSYGGTVPSPVAQPPQTPGFQNNTANPQWWKGGAAPATTGAPAPMGATSGYGSSTPTPAPPPAGTPAPPPAGTPPAGTPPKDPRRGQLKWQAEQMIASINRQILRMKKAIINSGNNDPNSNYGKQLQILYLELQKWQKQLADNA